MAGEIRDGIRERQEFYASVLWNRSGTIHKRSSLSCLATLILASSLVLVLHSVAQQSMLAKLPSRSAKTVGQHVFASTCAGVPRAGWARKRACTEHSPETGGATALGR
jgi:hypothetical protein